jgi:hypothetical protein
MPFLDNAADPRVGKPPHPWALRDIRGSLSASTIDAVAGRILGLLADCLRNPVYRTNSINVTEYEMHAAPTTAATENIDRPLNHVRFTPI